MQTSQHIAITAAQKKQSHFQFILLLLYLAISCSTLSFLSITTRGGMEKNFSRNEYFLSPPFSYPFPFLGLLRKVRDRVCVCFFIAHFQQALSGMACSASVPVAKVVGMQTGSGCLPHVLP